MQTYEPAGPGMIICSGDSGSYVLKTEALADKEEAVKVETAQAWGKFDEAMQALTNLQISSAEQIAALEVAVKEKEATLQEGCQIIAEGIKVVENLEEQIAALTAYKENNYDPAESIRLNAEIIALTAENKQLVEEIRVLRNALCEAVNPEQEYDLHVKMKPKAERPITLDIKGKEGRDEQEPRVARVIWEVLA